MSATALPTNLCPDPAGLEFTEAALPEDDPRHIHKYTALRSTDWSRDESDDPPPPKQSRRPPQTYPPPTFSPFELLAHRHTDGSYSLIASLGESGMVIEPELSGLMASALAGLGFYLPCRTCPSLRHVSPANLAEARAFFVALILERATPCDDAFPPAVEGVAALRRRMSELSEPQ